MLIHRVFLNLLLLDFFFLFAILKVWFTLFGMLLFTQLTLLICLLFLTIIYDLIWFYATIGLLRHIAWGLSSHIYTATLNIFNFYYWPTFQILAFIVQANFVSQSLCTNYVTAYATSTNLFALILIKNVLYSG